MSLDVAKDVLRFLYGSGADRLGFTFFGGEPMLEFDTVIKPLVEWSRCEIDKPVHFGMTTNGTLFSRERLNFLKENNIGFLLSMDGSSTAQGCNRPLANGENSFYAIEPYLPYILERWPMQPFRETLTEYNVGSYFEDILYFDSIGCRSLTVVPDFFKVWENDKINVLREQIKRYEEYIIREITDGRTPLLTHEYSTVFRNFAVITENKGGERRTVRGCQGCNKCGFGVKGSASIDPTGDIYGCHHITPLNRDSLFYLGNIYDGVDEWRVRRLVDSYDRSRVGNKMCAECGLDGICDGGCAPNNFQINGDVHKVPEMYCIWWRLMMDSGMRICGALSGNKMFQQMFVRGAFGR